MTKQISLSQELQISNSTLFDKIETPTNLTDSTVHMYLVSNTSSNTQNAFASLPNPICIFKAFLEEFFGFSRK